MFSFLKCSHSRENGEQTTVKRIRKYTVCVPELRNAEGIEHDGFS